MLPLVGMPHWLSVLTTALSLTVLLLCTSLDMTSIDQYVCMGCQTASPGLQVMAHTSPLTRLEPAIILVVALVTSPIAAFASSPSSPNSGTGMLVVLLPQDHGCQPVQIRRSQVSTHITICYVVPLI